MRLLSRKIWRAFPELDQFDDETCKRYMHRSQALPDSTAGCLAIIFVLAASFTAWVFIEYNARFALYSVLDTLDIKIGPYSEAFIVLVAFSGYIWFPWVSLLLLRDRWLYKSIRKQLRGALCEECEYSLLGLEIRVDAETWKYVLCPECGAKNGLKAGVLTEADIDPALFGES